MCLKCEHICISLTTDTSKGNVIFLLICGITLGPLYQSCCNHSYTIQGALSGADWRMIHGSCLLCSMSLLLHREEAVWSAWFEVEGFCFPLVFKWQICSVKCLWPQRLCKRCILFLGGDINSETLLTSNGSSQESWVLSYCLCQTGVLMLVVL